MTEYPRMKAKVCLVGERAVGKTSLIRRFVLDEFEDRYIATLGTKVSKKEIIVESANRGDGLTVDMTIWDIMGEKGFRELLKEAYFHGAQGILAVCDLTRRDTLKELDNWVQTVKRVTGEVPVAVLGNKVDLAEDFALTDDELARSARRHDAPYYLTSAKTGENVEKAFTELAVTIALGKAVAATQEEG